MTRIKTHFTCHFVTKITNTHPHKMLPRHEAVSTFHFNFRDEVNFSKIYMSFSTSFLKNQYISHFVTKISTQWHYQKFYPQELLPRHDAVSTVCVNFRDEVDFSIACVPFSLSICYRSTYPFPHYCQKFRDEVRFCIPKKP